MRYFKDQRENEYWRYDETSGVTLWFSDVYSLGGEVSGVTLSVLLDAAAANPDKEGEITEAQALAIRASWNLPTPAVDPDTARKLAAWDGLVFALERIANGGPGGCSHVKPCSCNGSPQTIARAALAAARPVTPPTE